MRSIWAVVGSSCLLSLSLASHLRSDLAHSFQELTRWKANETYAVLVAGSNTYENYRHQADVCHAYQLLSSHGVPDENIVVMMYDDIAFDSENPRQGEIINRPGGEDVYAGVPKDYTGEQVTATHFLKVLRGEHVGVGSGKTLRSGPRSHVFIYYADHGASGLVSMPTGEYLYANDLMHALQDMHDRHKYKQLVFYLEACESGSMFADLNTGLNIYATTASNPFESSYACYYDEDLGTYLGDCYSVAWLEDSDVSDLTHETLESQFDKVKNITTESEVMQYGQLQIDTEPVASFQAGLDEQARRHRRLPYPPVDRSPLDSRDIRLFYLSQKVASAQTPEQVERYTEQLNAEIESRERADGVFTIFAEQISAAEPQGSDVDEGCLRRVVEGTEEACGKFTTYSLKYVRYLHDACQRGVAPELTLDIINTICNNSTADVNTMLGDAEARVHVAVALA